MGFEFILSRQVIRHQKYSYPSVALLKEMESGDCVANSKTDRTFSIKIPHKAVGDGDDRTLLHPSVMGLKLRVKYELTAIVKHSGSGSEEDMKLSIPITIVRNLQTDPMTQERF